MENLSKGELKPSEVQAEPVVEHEPQPQKSPGPTGPRTAAGKELASHNSTNHRIFAGQLLPSEAQSAAMMEKELQTEFHARGAAERSVIRRLAQNLIERDRIDKWAEQQARLAKIDHLRKRAEAQPRELVRPPVHDEAPVNVLRRHLWDSTPELLRGLKKAIEKRGIVNPEELAQIEKISGLEITPVSETAMLLCDSVLRALAKNPSDPASQRELDAFCERIIDIISTELKCVEMRDWLDVSRLDLETSADYVALPPENVVSLINRYRTANDRERTLLYQELLTVRRCKAA
jgi:hypothetical protein